MFKPRFIKQAAELVQGAHKLIRYRKDLLAEEKIVELQQAISVVEGSAKQRDRQATETAMEALHSLCLKFAPLPKNAGWRENCEVLLVAIVIAAGIKAYFLQPFKIPTGSMQPTLNGIVGFPQEVEAPNFIVKTFDYLIRGRNYIDLVSEVDGNQVLGLQEVKRFHFFTFTKVKLKDGVHTVYAPQATLMKYFKVNGRKVYHKGEVIARGYIDTGDQVFVDKVSYNFRNPKRGDVFVFKTTGIRKIEATLPPGIGSQYYIKRLVGVPSDELRVAPPTLFVNGEPAVESPIQRVIAASDGYQGYSNGGAAGGTFEFLGSPRATFKVPEHTYWAMGDNSYNSSDSRHWGTVAEKNVVGRGFAVYWPFSSHWGRID